MNCKQQQICELVKCIEDSGGDMIKTNTGKFKGQFNQVSVKEFKERKELSKARERRFSDLLEDVQIINSWTDLPIKASGGIDTSEKALELVKEGASIIGTSSDFWV